jgi:hypothetical protein
LHELANAFVAGHLIECSNYITGGNFTGFKDLESKGWLDIGYPIAEISANGQVVITKSKGSGGDVSTQTCSSQLLYEIQGPWYYNSDVTAVLDELWFEQLGPNRVALHGVKGELPPSTTKVGLTAKGGYQAEVHWFPCGLDIPKKAQMLEQQVRLRVFAQAPKEEDLSPGKFLRPVIDPIMQSYPGATFHLDLRTAFPKPIYEYYVTLLPQSDVEHRVHLWDESSFVIPPPPQAKTYSAQQPSQQATENEVTDFGPTTRGPLGWMVHARSGDKGSNANVGLWVRHKDEWDWLRSLLSVETMKKLLADEYNGKKVDRFELPNLYAVHFLLHDHLDRGVSCSSSYDFLGKNVAEYLRNRHVDLPNRFLNRVKL